MTEATVYAADLDCNCLVIYEKKHGPGWWSFRIFPRFNFDPAILFVWCTDPDEAPIWKDMPIINGENESAVIKEAISTLVSWIDVPQHEAFIAYVREQWADWIEAYHVDDAKCAITDEEMKRFVANPTKWSVNASRGISNKMECN